MARALAQRVWAEADDSTHARIDKAFRLVLVRPPTAAELDVLTATLERLRQPYADDQQAAQQLLSVGATSRDESIDPVEHAAYTSLCLAILNLDEALTKE